MPSLRDEITKTIRRLSGRVGQHTKEKPQDLEETLLATDSRVGRQYGSYRILRRLGAGGMGHVYLAMDTRLGRYAALKFLSPKLKSNPEMLARLQQEARTASSLNHPNILTIYDIDEADGEPFIASEFVEGATLRQALERGVVDPASALDIAIQIASALKPAHEAGVIHRDLKPGNVMLRPDGLVKVIDFGLAKFTAQGHITPMYEPLSDPGSVAGTVQYMSPEQARGDEVDRRTDLWSLGVMLYEMVSRKKPFDGETDSHVIVAILDRRPAELKTGAGIPVGIEKVVEKALAKSPDKRYQTAQEMLSALKALEVSSQSRPSRVFAAALKRRRNLHWAWVAGLASLIAAALAIWWWPFHGREVVMGPDWFVPVNYTQVTHRGDVSIAALAPDGKQVAYTTKDNAQDQLHLLNMDTGKVFDWPSFTGNTVGITFSPDSSTVYYTVHDQAEWGRLYAAKMNSLDPAFVLDDVDGPVAFSPDGKEFAFRRRTEEKRTNHEKIIIAKKQDTGNQETVLDKYNTSVGTRISWSTDGLMAVNLIKQSLDGDVPPTILIFARNGKELAEYTSPKFRGISGPAWLDHGSELALTSFGPGEDRMQPTFVELATRSGQFQFFATPNLIWTSVTASRDFQEIAAVTSERKSVLWMADAQTLDAPHQWASGDGFQSPVWISDDAIAYSSPRGGSIHLWERTRDGGLREFPKRNDCAMQQPAAAPQKRLLVFSSNCEASANASNLWVLNQDDGTLVKLTDHSQSDSNPAVSPDGDTVLYNSWPNNFPALLKISLRTRVSSPFTTLQARNPAISPDGQHVACQIRENYDGRWRVAVLSMRDGTIEKDNLPLPTSLNSTMRWSPTGKALDYVDAHDAANVWRLALDGAPAVPLTHRRGDGISDFAWNPTGTRIAMVTSDVRQDLIIFHRRSL